MLGACGGAEEPGSNATPQATAVAAGGGTAAPSASTGTAGQGAACDYGGADSYTCASGLQCCYGEHARPDGYGSCQPECNWD